LQIIRIISQIAILFLFYFVGDFIVSVFHIKFPGSIVGLLLLWICLYFKWLNIKFVMDGTNFLITFLTLFFIPSTVGIIQYPELLTKNGLLLIVAVFISSIFAFIFTGKLSQYLEKVEDKRGEI
jgi:holin-like protein